MEPFNADRRKLSLALAGFSMNALVPGISFANSSVRFKLDSVHLQTAQKARELSDQKKVVLRILLPQGSRANVLPATKEFTRLSGIQFEFIETPVDDINTRMFLDSQMSQGSYDIALPATFGIPDLAEAGAIAPLDEFSSLYEPEAFQQSSLYTIGDYYRNRHYGYQTDGDTYLMFYNKDFLENEDQRKSFSDKHGHEPRVPQTWQELDRMMAHFHDPARGVYGGALFRVPTYMLWEWWVRFHAKGYFPLDNNLTPQINNDAGVEALQELINVTQYLTPNAASNGLFDNWKEFADGNIFCNIGWGGTQKYLNSEKSAIRSKLVFGPTPGGIVNGKLLQTSYFNWGWNYTVANNSTHKELAYLFALFACSPSISTLAVREQDGYFDPFRNEHYQDEIIKQTYTDAFMQEHRKSMENSIPDLYLRGQTQYYDALRKNIAAAYEGSISAKSALDQTAKTWNRLHLKLNRKIQGEQWQFLKKRYPRQLQDALT